MKGLILKLQKVRNQRKKTPGGEVTTVSLCKHYGLRGAEVLGRKWDIPWTEKQHFWHMDLISLLLYHRKRNGGWEVEQKWAALWSAEFPIIKSLWATESGEDQPQKQKQALVDIHTYTNPYIILQCFVLFLCSINSIYKGYILFIILHICKINIYVVFIYLFFVVFI